MTTYPNIKNEPEFLKLKTKDVEIKNLKNQRENMILRIYLNHLRLIMNIIKRNMKV